MKYSVTIRAEKKDFAKMAETGLSEYITWPKGVTATLTESGAGELFTEDDGHIEAIFMVDVKAAKDW